MRNSLVRKSSVMGDDQKQEAPLRFFKPIKNENILQKYTLRLTI